MHNFCLAKWVWLGRIGTSKTYFSNWVLIIRKREGSPRNGLAAAVRIFSRVTAIAAALMRFT